MRKMLRFVLPALIGLGLLLPAAAADAEGVEGVDEEALRSIELLMQQRVAELYKEKNQDGLRYRQGRYSHNYEKVDEDTYLIPFHRDTAIGDSMLTERLTLTVTREGKKWAVTDEILEDSYQGLYRTIPGDETFHTFESVQFSREGLTVSAGRGSLVKDTKLGRISSIFLRGENLDWTYEPPTAEYVQLFEVLLREETEDLVIEPEAVMIRCDPESCEELLGSAFQGIEEANLDGIDDILGKRYKDWLDEQENARKDNPFSGFPSSPDDPTHRWYTVAIKRAINSTNSNFNTPV